MTTNRQENLFIKNNQLYIMPTLTTASTSIGFGQLLDGGSYTLDGCNTGSSGSANCTVKSSNSSKATIPPIMSARLTTANFTTGSIKYGKVQVRAKLPRGDWLWPAIWMLPKSNAYGPWPLSGEIDVCVSRFVIDNK
jgi:hypothetical protein